VRLSAKRKKTQKKELKREHDKEKKKKERGKEVSWPKRLPFLMREGNESSYPGREEGKREKEYDSGMQ